jgi:succinyl-diaminopimelate desuccinylase
VSRLQATLELVRLDSVSGREAALAAHIVRRLAAVDHLDVDRVGDNVIARTTGSRPQRVIIAGHLDTVPGDASIATIDGDRVVGLGACDMKGSLAVMIEEALRPTTPLRSHVDLLRARRDLSLAIGAVGARRAAA